MNISAAELKTALRKLAPAKTETYIVGEHGVMAQDSDVWIVVQSPLSGLGVPFSIDRKFASVVSRMSGQIEITRGEKSLILKSAKARVELAIQNVKPPVFPKSPVQTMALPSGPLKKALAVAAASASPAKSAVFGGTVQLQSLPLGLEEETPSGYRVVGTDSIVLTMVTVDDTPVVEFKTLLNLSAAAVVQLMDGESIALGETNAHVFMSGGGTVLYAAKPVQKYPNFDKFLTMPAIVSFSFRPEALAEALRTVEPLIDESVDQGGISLLFKGDMVQCSSVGTGSVASDEAACEQVDPDPIFDPKEISLRVKAKNLAGFLAKAKDMAVLSLIDDPGKPLADKPVRLESENTMVFTMPMGKKKETK